MAERCGAAPAWSTTESRTIVATLNFPQLRRVKTLFEFSFSFFSFQNWNALGPNFGTALNIRNFYKYL